MKIKSLLFALFIVSIFVSSCGDDECANTVWFEDLDGDGLGNPESTKTACDKPAGFVSDDSDEFDVVIGDEQRAVIAYAGATWCPPCGEYGGPLLDYVDENFGSSKAVVLSFQISDRISPASTAASEYGDELQDAVNSNSIPRIFVGASNYFVDRGIYTSNQTNQNVLSGEINSIVVQDAAIGVNGSAKRVDNKIEVNVGVKFNNGSDSEFFISAYLLEDGVVADQKVGSTSNPSTEPDVVHNHIVRENIDSATSYKGKSLGNSFSQGEVVSETFTISIPTLPAGTTQIDTDNIKVALVVWSGGNSPGMQNGMVIDIE